MSLSTLRFPRKLEADGTDRVIRECLMTRMAKLGPSGDEPVAVISLNAALEVAIRRARLQGRIRFGAEPILEKLASEQKGIDPVKTAAGASYGERVSRLLIVANDGSERFYHRIEQTLVAHAPRIMGCLLDADGGALGQAITGRPGTIKILLIEHKDAVSDILRTMAGLPVNKD